MEIKKPAIRLTLPDFLILLSIIFIASVANVILKVAGTKFSFPSELKLEELAQFIKVNYLVFVGYALYMIPSFLTVILYKKYKVGYIQALVSGVYIITPLLAFIFNIEKLNFLKVLGISLIFLAVCYLSLSKDETN